MKPSLPRLICALVNVAGLPGAGTLLAGRRMTGWCQVALSLALMAGTFLGLIRLIQLLWIKGAQAAGSSGLAYWTALLIETPEEWTALAIAVACAVLYLANLLWSLASARPRSAASPPPLPSPPPGGS